ncbi:HpcH/HpaI aldolase/citrate lyase family protein [Desulfosporosinus shakirovi]|uniref:HpcH/HpaI aldolase/citrate lyase family protein n=1 Tax=Desulfosporosinus shakirovi TaxID=2885154 RepID=UPI001E2AB98B|nr:HpcH/HpaI aldolase/citrate lyase family protein [Desulfosporosinus sp. SRJS8]MCB8817253.1 HpcH/HpaI aldolase/citrate lyase family protein [Desulfosporosinus sp. SRJS8]
MRHFNYLTKEGAEATFFRAPEVFDNNTHRGILSHALGATLYMPGTRETIAKDIISKKNRGLASTVFCLEDSIGDAEVPRAERNISTQVQGIYKALNEQEIEPIDLPLIFIRVRSAEQILRLMDRMGDSSKLITGFIFPKFTSESHEYFETVKSLNQQSVGPFYGMPIIESTQAIYRESRIHELIETKRLLDSYHDLVLNVRIGATDFSGYYGIRRGPDVTIYDITVIRDCIADIINIFGRVESDYTISGPVWEYFSNGGRFLKPQLRKSPFEQFQDNQGNNRTKIRSQLLNKYVDGLIREVILDKENGIIGKTIIHPSHIIPVQSLYIVGYEEYLDALSIIENSNGLQGVTKSHYTNKMNEVKPHYKWAQKILLRAKNYGVFHEQHNFISLFTEDIYV